MCSELSFRRQPRAPSLPLAELGVNCSECVNVSEGGGERERERGREGEREGK